jgi:hypothetical protein
MLGFETVEDTQKSLAVEATDWFVKEARPYCAVRFNHCRDPWCVAARRNWRAEIEVSAEMARDPVKFFGTLENETGAGPLSRQRIDLTFEKRDFALIERDLGLLLRGPMLGVIERLRGQVRREERNGVQTELLGGTRGFAQTKVVGALNGRTG